jgi:hypothetical protein
VAVPAALRRLAKADQYLSSDAAVERARAVLAEFTRPGDVGEYLGIDMLGDRVGNLRFACGMAGYVGWTWAVTVARVPRGRTATVSETELVPGADALLSPQWVPWAERLRPGDLGPGDILPHVVQDPRLEPGFEATGDHDGDRLAIWELGLGRARVLSPEGRDQAAVRWYSGSRGPTAPEAVKAAAPCSTCGFVMPLGGGLRTLFGVCANEWSGSDGQVVSYDHGCGAHSETDVGAPDVKWPEPAPLIDDSVVVTVDLGRPAASAGAPGPAGVADADQPEPQPGPADPEPLPDVGAADGPDRGQDHQGD